MIVNICLIEKLFIDKQKISQAHIVKLKLKFIMFCRYCNNIHIKVYSPINLSMNRTNEKSIHNNIISKMFVVDE